MAEPDRDSFDDCWNRIGVWAREGRDCPHLEEHVHCRNCAVFRDAGHRILDRRITTPDGSAPGGAESGTPIPSLPDHQESSLYGDAETAGEALHGEEARSLWLLFHLGRGWYALPGRIVERVTEPRPVHDLPHKRGRALLGLVNVSGRLHPCMDMARVLDVPPSPPQEETERNHYRRLILLNDQGNRFAFHATGVTSLHQLEREDPLPLPDGSEGAPGAIRGTCEWEGGILSLLDPDAIFLELTRGLQ